MSRGRGAVLLELMLALALFVGAAALCLTATRSLFAALDRADRRQWAIDLARSKMAELDAGLVSLPALRGEWSGAVGSHRPRDLSPDEPAAETRWRFDVRTQRSAFDGLTLIELTVSEVPGEAVATGEDPALVSYTLRQLVALREASAGEFETDELLEGLPEAGAAPPPGPEPGS